MKQCTYEEAASRIEKGEIGIVPTDTVYGVVSSAFNKDSVERVYAVRGREMDKPCIILIPKPEDVVKFGVEISGVARRTMMKYWPGSVSIVFPCVEKRFSYLHRRTNSLAFRVPDPKHWGIVELLRQTGPLLAPSANLEGHPVVKTIEGAEEMFPDTVDFCVDGGLCDSPPSTLLSTLGGGITVLRDGAVPYVKE